MNSPPFDELISAYLDGELDAVERAQVERVLHDDARLRRTYNQFKALRTTLQALPHAEPDEELTAAILRHAEHRMAAPQADAANQSLSAKSRTTAWPAAQHTRDWRFGLIIATSVAALVLLALFVPATWNRRIATAPRNIAMAEDREREVMAAPDSSAAGESAPSAPVPSDGRNSRRALLRFAPKETSEKIAGAPAAAAPTVGGEPMIEERTSGSIESAGSATFPGADLYGSSPPSLKIEASPEKSGMGMPGAEMPAPPKGKVPPPAPGSRSDVKGLGDARPNKPTPKSELGRQPAPSRMREERGGQNAGLGMGSGMDSGMGGMSGMGGGMGSGMGGGSSKPFSYGIRGLKPSDSSVGKNVQLQPRGSGPPAIPDLKSQVDFAALVKHLDSDKVLILRVSSSDPSRLLTEKDRDMLSWTRSLFEKKPSPTIHFAWVEPKANAPSVGATGAKAPRSVEDQKAASRVLLVTGSAEQIETVLDKLRKRPDVQLSLVDQSKRRAGVLRQLDDVDVDALLDNYFSKLPADKNRDQPTKSTDSARAEPLGSSRKSVGQAAGGPVAGQSAFYLDSADWQNPSTDIFIIFQIKPATK